MAKRVTYRGHDGSCEIEKVGFSLTSFLALALLIMIEKIEGTLQFKR